LPELLQAKLKLIFILVFGSKALNYYVSQAYETLNMSEGGIACHEVTATQVRVNAFIISY